MIRKSLSEICKSSSRKMLKQIKIKIKKLLKMSHPFDSNEAASLSEQIRRRFEFYQTDNLKTISPEEFSDHIHSQIGTIDAKSEGYSEEELERQRDLSIKFHWGHNHDFGTFYVKGEMGDRHINLLANFVSMFPVSLDSFNGKEVLDVGCWTGGTTLLLSLLGSRVLAIEEVKKYAEVVCFLAESFGISEKVRSEPLSVYNCDSEEFYDRFDIVYFPGVIYHLSDPLIALRILFNSLKVGGEILIESAGINHDKPLCKFTGSLVHHKGRKGKLNRGGWNWFLPSPSALSRMMREAGFDEIDTVWHEPSKRVFGYGKKLSQESICRAGLSKPDVR